MVEPIKQSFTLTDTQVSLLQGLAFMGAYIAFGPVFGRWVDNGNRRNVLTFGLATWSSFTMLGGFAGHYGTLFAARAGVGAAEACITPSAWSILSDYFSRERLPRAMSVFLMGPYIGGGLALIFGGLVLGSADALAAAVPPLARFEPWQLTLVMIGMPGLLLAVWLRTTVREPLRTSGVAHAGQAKRFSLREVAAFLWHRRAFFGRFYGAMSLIVIVLYAFPAWMPAYLIRVHDADAARLGLQYGALVLIGGSVGVLTGPLIGAWFARRGDGASAVRVPALAACALAPITLLLPFAPSYASALAIAAAATIFYSLPQAMAATALQLATPNRMRGVVSSLYVFLVSLTGLGLAPTLVALLTDYAFADATKVGWSLGLVCGAAAAAAAWLALRALPHYRTMLARAETELA